MKKTQHKVKEVDQSRWRGTQRSSISNSGGRRGVEWGIIYIYTCIVIRNNVNNNNKNNNNNNNTNNTTNINNTNNTDNNYNNNNTNRLITI